MYGQYPSSYKITLTELTTNKTVDVELKRKGDKVLSHKFTSIPDGAVYNVSISSNAVDAESVTMKVHAPPLPSVRQLKVYDYMNNGTYAVYWHEVNGNDKK